MRYCFYIFVVAGFLFFSRMPACAEWVTIKNFRGLEIDKSPADLEFNQARKSVGWFYRSGMLVRRTLMKYNHGDTPDATGLKFLIFSNYYIRLLFSDADSLRQIHSQNDGSSSYIDSSTYWNSTSYVGSFEAESSAPVYPYSTYLYNNTEVAHFDGNKLSGIANFSQGLVAVLHNRRAWWARGTFTTTLYYSDQADYNSVHDTEELDGTLPIVWLSSFGPQLVIYRFNGIEYIVGVTMDDFYKTKVPCAVGVEARNSVARDQATSQEYFVNSAGLYSFDGTRVNEADFNCRSIFSDSIYWHYAFTRLCGVVYDNMYLMAAPFGTSNKNNRLMFFNIQSGDVGFIGGLNAGCFLRCSRETDEGRLYIGDADSTVIWLLDKNDDVWFRSDWRSGWYDGDKAETEKAVIRYKITYYSMTGDTVFCHFYADYNENPVWTDIVVASSGGLKTRNAAVDRAVFGYSLGIGLRSADSTMRIIEFGMDVVSRETTRKE